MRRIRSRALPAALLLLAALSGCQPARTYDPRPAAARAKVTIPEGDKPAKPAAPAEKPLTEDLAWIDTGREPVAAHDTRIEFVHAGSNPEQWQKLQAFWTDVPAEPGGKRPAVVRLKVPLGLDDPQAYIPAGNPPTKLQWQLGHRLFFDPSWLTAQGKQSCATCHDPNAAFTDGKRVATPDGFNTPTLVNVVYNARQFWDGRATYLEEVVQARLEDERAPKGGAAFRHAWPGVIGRLRGHKGYNEHFHRVYGVAPTQDTVGRAVAAYLRTLLAGDSIHDRAEWARRQKGGRTLTAAHYQAALDEAALAALGRARADKAAVAAELLRGHGLYLKAGCAACHLGDGTFSDGRFYNIGLSDGSSAGRLGRFAAAPLGERHRNLRGAFKVPTLRTLWRTRPYFHAGQAADVAAAVRQHFQADARAANRYLSPKLLSGLRLSDDDVSALVLFLRALDGGEVDSSVRTPPG